MTKVKLDGTPSGNAIIAFADLTNALFIGLPGVVFVVFLVLKLVGVIDWSWWWVTAPLWGSALIWLAVVVVILVAAAVKR